MAQEQFGIDSLEYVHSLEIDGVRRIVKPMIFRNANIEARVAAWPAALNGTTGMGCSINVLRFLDIIDRQTAAGVLNDPNIVHPQEGTSMETIIAHFNSIFGNNGINRVCVKLTTNILTQQKLTDMFNMFHRILEPNMCMIVRYGRAVAEANMFRPRQADGTQLSAGHYVIVAKSQNRTLVTIDPQNRSSHDYNWVNGVSDNFWRVWSTDNGYNNISILCVYEPDVEGGSPRSTHNKEIITKSGAYVVPKNIMKQFEKAFIKSNLCSTPSLFEKNNVAMPSKNTQRYKNQSKISRGGRRHRNKTHVKLKIGIGTKRNP